VRPAPGQEEPYEPYFIAICDCGWVGKDFSTSADAFDDARQHSPLVSEEIRRPVG
jgi:hypothetical protein